MEPASLQDNSATLSVASIVLASQEFDGKLEQMDHDTYLDKAQELGLPEIVYDVPDYDLLQRQLKQDMYDPEVLEQNWNEFFQDDISLESIQEKTGNTFEFSDKQQPGNIGSRFGVPEFEFPTECRSCGERPRIDGSFYCPECHPDRNAEDVDDSELVTEKHEEKQSVNGHPEIPVEGTAPEAVEFLDRMEREGYDPSEEDEALLYELLGTGTPEWKMSKEDADYKQEPEGSEICANCQYYYVGTDGEGVCSKVRGQVYAEHWCRLWDAGDVLQGKSDKAKRTDELFGRDESNSNTAQTGDNQFDKSGSGFEVDRRKVFERGAQLSDGHFELLDSAFKEQVWPDGLQKAPSWANDDDVTGELQEWVNSVLELQDPLWDNYETIPAAAGLTVKQEIKDSLTQSQGWSLNSIDRRLREEFKYMAPHERERIARQETAAVLNKAKIVSLQARGDDPEVKWVGPDDEDTTELCTSLKDEIGDGVAFSTFMPLLNEYANEYENGTPERADEGLPHFLCRHTIEIV